LKVKEILDGGYGNLFARKKKVPFGTGGISLPPGNEKEKEVFIFLEI
jgi:hypothetical protein